jgi:hypothetical protein
MRDDDVPASCFAALEVLQAQHGPELPWSVLRPGFAYRGRRVPFLNRAYGITVPACSAGRRRSPSTAPARRSAATSCAM